MGRTSTRRVADHHVHLGLLDLKEAVPILLKEVGKSTRIEKFSKLVSGVADQVEIDDFCHANLFSPGSFIASNSLPAKSARAPVR